MKPFDDASKYAQTGIPVFPVRPGGKTPALIGWQRLATTDSPTIAGWRSSPNVFNIGIPTGAVSKLVVIDLDVKNGVDGIANWHNLVASHSSVPTTWEAETPSGGKHLYFRPPPGIHIKGSAGKLGPGIDVRGDGGLIVAPPSRLGHGAYSWLVSPWNCGVAQMPPWLVRLLTQPPARPTAGGVGNRKTHPTKGRQLPAEYKGWRVKTIPEGYRDEAIHSHGSALRRYGAHEQLIRDALNHLNETACEPPLPPDDIERIAGSAAKYRPERRFSTKIEKARELLLRRLHDGSVRAEEAYRLGGRHGIKKRTMRQARDYFGDLIRTRKVNQIGGSRGAGYWEWYLSSP